MDAFYIPWIVGVSTTPPTLRQDSYDGSKVVIKQESRDEPQYKLTFFPARGMAEMSRLVLVYAGVPFVDNRIGFEEWQKVKDDSLFQQMPILEFDGKMLCESAAICRYLARKYHLAGKDLYEQAQVDAIVDLLKDFGNAIRPLIAAIVMQYASDGHDCRPPVVQDDILKPAVETYFPKLEKAAAVSTGFFMPSGVTWADFALTNMYETVENMRPDYLSSFVSLRRIVERVLALPQLQSYLASRPKTVL